MGITSKKSADRCMLKGNMRKAGFDRWRMVTCGMSSLTGEERVFFFEFYMVNPLISPNQCILGFKNLIDSYSAENLQFALAGTESATSFEAEKYLCPSYLMVKAGVYGKNGKHVNAFFPCGELDLNSEELNLTVGGSSKGACTITSEHTSGSVSVTSKDLTDYPEYLCNAGKFSWNLRFRKVVHEGKEFTSKSTNWQPLGLRTAFEGAIVMDGEEFNVRPEKSYGFYDKYWGKNLNETFFHVSGCDFTSTINGAHLKGSAFSVQGDTVDKNHLNIVVNIEGKRYEFDASKNNYNLTYSARVSTDDDDSKVFHWSVSVNNHSTYLDIDVFCNVDDLFIRHYECPTGARKLLKILGGGTGTGELRLYKKVKRDLEMIEHLNITNVLCEYGGADNQVN